MVFIFLVLCSIIFHEAAEWKENEKNKYHIVRWTIAITDLSRAVKNIFFEDGIYHFPIDLL